MKYFLVITLFMIFSIAARSGIIKWDGEAGDGMWQSGGNWIGDVVPGAGDEVVLDHSIITTSYVVTLPITAVSIVSLRISPGVGVNTIKLVIPVSSTISMNAFMTTGTGYTIILDDRAIFENNATVSSGTNLSIADSIRIDNGGRYVHRTRSGHAGWVSRLARIAGTENGTMEFDVPTASYVISLSGRTYGNLVFSSINHGLPVTYSGTGASPLNIRGSLTINNNAGFSISLSADLVIHGSCHLTSNSSTFNLQNSTSNNVVRLLGNINSQGVLTKTGTGVPQLMLNGSALQQVSITGSFINNIRFGIDNPSGAVLMASLNLPYHLQLTNGIIRTGSTHIISIVDNAVVSGGGSASFVDGTMSKTGDEAFTFHVGEGLEYAPIAINAGGVENDVYTARYFRGNPMLAIGAPFESPPIDHISGKEWWTLERIAGNAARAVTLHTRAYTNATLLPELRVLRWNGTMWMNEGNTAVSGTPAAGSITSNSITDFLPSGSPTPFTFGSISSLSNPLPINLLSFDATQLSDKRVSLAWALADKPNQRVLFEIQRSGSGSVYQAIGNMQSSSNSRTYHYIDNSPLRGENRYRLRITDDDGVTSFSTIIKVNISEVEKALMTLNVCIQGINAVVNTHATMPLQMELLLFDISGRQIMRRRQHASAGLSKTRFSLENLARGVYVLVAMVGGRKCCACQFVW